MNNKDILNKTSVYDVITNDTPELLVPEDDTDFKLHHIVTVSKEEYYVIDKFYDAHRDCRILPDGRHRYGAIGGGFEKRAYMKQDGSFKFICKCMTCNEVLDVEEAVKNIKDGEIPEEYEFYQGYGMFDIVEWSRFKKFCTDHEGHSISVGFMGTGLGYLINVKDEDTGEYADITYTDNW